MDQTQAPKYEILENVTVPSIFGKSSYDFSQLNVNGAVVCHIPEGKDVLFLQRKVRNALANFKRVNKDRRFLTRTIKQEDGEVVVMVFRQADATTEAAQ